MKPINSCTSACRCCRFYQPEGRRGGMCQQLGVTVQASWTSCNFASPVFASDWQPMTEIALLEKSFSLGCATPRVSQEKLAETETQKAPLTQNIEEMSKVG